MLSHQVKCIHTHISFDIYNGLRRNTECFTRYKSILGLFEMSHGHVSVKYSVRKKINQIKSAKKKLQRGTCGNDR